MKILVTGYGIRKVRNAFWIVRVDKVKVNVVTLKGPDIEIKFWREDSRSW